MEQDSNPSGLCKMGCGFFGNQSFEGMCSKCYRDFVKRQQQSSPSTGRASPASCVGTSVSALANTLITNAQTQAAATAQQAVADSASPVQVPLAQAPQSVAEPSTGGATAIAPAVTVEAVIPSPSKPIDIPHTPEKTSPASEGSGSAAATPSSVGGTPTSPGDGEDASPGKMKKRNRCFSCRKKVGLTGFECRCGGLFCGIHRYSDKHQCTFDYKADGRQQLTKANPLVVGEKVAKI